MKPEVEHAIDSIIASMDETPPPRPLTVCTDCRHHKGHGSIWYDQYCMAPAVRRKKQWDCVTGEFGYDYGGPYPHCRDINRGNCSHFEPSGNLLDWAKRKLGMAAYAPVKEKT